MIHHVIANDTFKLYIDNLLHLSLNIHYLVGLQSWKPTFQGEYYTIEFYYLNKQVITCEYVDEKLWKEILEIVDKLF